MSIKLWPHYVLQKLLIPFFPTEKKKKKKKKEKMYDIKHLNQYFVPDFSQVSFEFVVTKGKYIC